jgi:hypothetical protein
MSRLTLFIFVAGFAAAGCSHNSTKSENAAVPVAKPDTAKPAEAVAKSNASTKVECSVKGDNRILEVRTKDKGCELIYTKHGTEGSIASSTHGADHCEKALEKVRDKLKGSGYECK